ncbi:MAG: hypothetical protein ACE5R6_06580 [Candidatus Heimdallarchaeota archaeon]
MDCPKCGAKREWDHTTETLTLTETFTVDVTFSINCSACEWNAEVTVTNSVRQEEVNEIYVTESEDGD